MVCFLRADSEAALEGTGLDDDDLTWEAEECEEGEDECEAPEWMPVLEPVTSPAPNYAVLGYAKEEVVWDADDPRISPVPTDYDLALSSLDVPATWDGISAATGSVTVENFGPGDANGTITITGTNYNGVAIMVPQTINFTDLAAETSDTWTFPIVRAVSWIPRNIFWTATVTADDDANPENNTAAASTRVATVPTGYDLALSSLDVPATWDGISAVTGSVSVDNIGPGDADGTVTITGANYNGVAIMVPQTINFTDLAAETSDTWTFPIVRAVSWIPRNIFWTATVTADDDANPENNTATAVTRFAR